MPANVFLTVDGRGASAAAAMAVIVAGLVGCGLSTPAVAGDWPQILGPGRNGVAAADERLADRWPDGGPRVVWRRPVGAGHAGVAVAGRRVVLFHREGGREIIESLDAATGRAAWTDSHPTTFSPQVGGGDGPLCVPVIHGDRVIVFGAQGVLACLDAADGKRLWSRQTHREFNAPEGYFGAGSSPVVVGDGDAAVVIVNVGGARDEAGIVAFSLADGRTVWRKTSEPASYSSPVAVTVGGEPHVLMVTRFACLLLDPFTGAIRWQFPFGQRGPTVNAASPLVIGGNRLLVTASYGIGSVCAGFDRAGFTTAWEGADSLATQYCTPIERDGRLYAIDGRDDLPPTALKCIDAGSGRVVWSEENFGYGTLLLADGKLVVAKTDGELLLVRPDPTGLSVLSRARVLDGTVRALPALANGRLYVRDDRALACLDLAARPAAE
jgi:outer membrane protein assembly factor BamB